MQDMYGTANVESLRSSNSKYYGLCGQSLNKVVTNCKADLGNKVDSYFGTTTFHVALEVQRDRLQ